MHLAAACTSGKLLPNMERMEPFNVIYQTAEDGLGDTVKPRLIEAGADLDRVLVIKHHEPEMEETPDEESARPSVLAALNEKSDKEEPVKPFRSYSDRDGDAR